MTKATGSSLPGVQDQTMLNIMNVAPPTVSSPTTWAGLTIRSTGTNALHAKNRSCPRWCCCIDTFVVILYKLKYHLGKMAL